MKRKFYECKLVCLTTVCSLFINNHNNNNPLARVHVLCVKNKRPSTPMQIVATVTLSLLLLCFLRCAGVFSGSGAVLLFRGLCARVARCV
jgi:hypothetical protein